MTRFGFASRCATVLCAGVAILLLSVFLLPGSGKAQHVCGSGPGPGEVQVGMAPGGNGVAPTPMCDWANTSNNTSPSWANTPAPPLPPHPQPYAAFAADPDSWLVSWGIAGSTPEAEQLAAAECKKTGGKKCATFGAFNNSCGAVVGAQNGRDYVGIDRRALFATKKAIDDCEAANHDSNNECKLLNAPICAGPGYIAADNDNAANMPADKIGRALNKRQYWGAISTDGDFIGGGYGFRDPANASKLAVKGCDKCKVVKTFENTCVGIAWLGAHGSIHDLVENRDPKVAQDQAQKKCSKSLGGACSAAARCSSPDWPLGNPFAAPAKS